MKMIKLTLEDKCFNGLAGDCVRDFIEYPKGEEERGITEAETFFKEHTDIPPVIIMPVITKMKKNV